MVNPEQEMKTILIDLGLQDAEADHAMALILELRQDLADTCAKLKPEESWSGVAIANNPKAIQVVESMTDLIIERKGILEMAMRGEDIHDAVALIKAKIESLIIGGQVKAHTLTHITQRMKSMKKE